MKTATKAMIQKELAPYIQSDKSESYIREQDIRDITVRLLSNYTNVYCGNTIDKNGNSILSVNSTSSFKPFIEIIIK